MDRGANMVLGIPSISILSRDPNPSRKPPETQEKRIRCLKRTMVEKNGESTLEWWVSLWLPANQTQKGHLTNKQTWMENVTTLAPPIAPFPKLSLGIMDGTKLQTAESSNKMLSTSHCTHGPWEKIDAVSRGYCFSVPICSTSAVLPVMLLPPFWKNS